MRQKYSYISISESELYGLGRKRDLAKILGIHVKDLVGLIKDDNFKEWPKKEKGKKDRLIEQPLPFLSKTLSRLQSIISKVETPSYLMSGKKGVKPSDNAQMHRLNGYMINVDIEQFYQSTKREFVYSTFRNSFKQADDIASILSSLATYKGHIPTGTATSQSIAFWAYKKTFDRIDALCQRNGISMSIWVDDITFSSEKPFPKNWVRDIQKIMAEVELCLKTSKTKKYLAADYKIVTGSAISPVGDLRVKNQKSKEILDLLEGRQIERLPLRDARMIQGKLVAQRQNNPIFFNSVYTRLKKRLKELI